MHGVELIGVEKHSEDAHIILTFKNKDVLVFNESFVPVGSGNNLIFDDTRSINIVVGQY